MKQPLQRVAALACAVALACGMTPTAALADAGGKAALADAGGDGPRVASPVAAAEERAASIDAHADAYEDGKVIVVYRQGTESSARARGQAASGMAAQQVSVAGIPDATADLVTDCMGDGMGAAISVTLPEGVSVGQAVVTAEANPDVAYAQPNFRYKLLGEPAASAASALAAASLPTLALPDDPALQDQTNSGSSPNQWWIYAVSAPGAWEVVPAEKDVAVAVMDTGINFTHRDLQANILADYAWDAYLEEPLQTAPTGVPTSNMDHGSHVAGIVAAEADNGFGIAGVSYNAKILPICVFYESELRAEPVCDDEYLIRAYEYLLSDEDGDGRSIAEETNTRVVNMSLGGYLADDPDYEYDYAFEDIIERAEDEAGILTVAAGGNGDDFGNPRTDPSYPSDYDAVMSVVALKSATERTYWSDYNEHKDIAAPGADIYSTWYRGDSFTFKSGTSMASPLVAGVAALLWAYNPDLTVDDVKRALYTTADDLGARGYDKYYGWGRVNAEAAVKSLGTASVKAESGTMRRTATQQLSASSIANPDEQHEWAWTVVDPDSGEATDAARISADGVLTAVRAGSVEVRVKAVDDESLSGKRYIEIDEIAISGGISASANPNENTIAVQWPAADAATAYRVLRATGTDGDGGDLSFAPIDTVPASQAADDGEGNLSVTYFDRTARPSVEYWYQVVPLGTLDGGAVEGEESNAVRCYYTDKSALKQRIEAAEGLLSSTEVSDDGAEVSEAARWTTAAERLALNTELRAAYSAYYSGALLQQDVDAAADALADAAATFEKARKPGLVKAPAPASDPDPEPEPKPGPGDNPGSSESGSGSSASPQPDSGGASGSQPDSSRPDASGSSGASSSSGASGASDATDASGASDAQQGGSAGSSAADSGADANAGADSRQAPSRAGSAASASVREMHRLYNPNTGEHFYTSDDAEWANLVTAGWVYEGPAWNAPVFSDTAVYRLYNPYAGDHHYTTDALERETLVQAGWSNEGIGWFSDDAQGKGLRRLYNPYAETGAHHYTVSAGEQDDLVAQGWLYEGVGWYGCA